MSIHLYEHNQKAYEAAISMIRTERRAAIIHPTGTGKSFIAFKLVDEHPDARICWLAPSEYIYRTQLENLRKSMPEDATVSFANIRFWSYSKLMKNEAHIAELKPDYIVLDEFHRCGAAEWGKSVRKLLEQYPDAGVLGLSATNIRYLDNQRDMAQEIFGGNIASEMTLGEAIARGILATPKYIVALYSYQRELKKLEQQVDEKNQELLEQLKRALEQADGLDQVFARHMTKKQGKYLVFCSDKEHMDEMKEHTQEWFAQIDSEPHVYTAYYNNPETSREFAAFKEDNSHHLKLLFCIDMLNEGVHVDDIDGVILLRPTISPVVYLQQIGRSLCAGNETEPVIFDLVNNFDSLSCIDFLEQEVEEAYQNFPGEAGERTRFHERFQVIDEVKECRSLFQKLQENLRSSWETYYLAAVSYYKEKGNLKIPKSYVTETGMTLGSWIMTQRRGYAGKVSGELTAEKIEKLNAIHMIWDLKSSGWEEGYGELLAYYQTHKNVDVKARYITESGFALGRWISNLRAGVRKKGIDQVLDAGQQEQLAALGMIWDKSKDKWETYLSAAKEYRSVHGNLKVPAKYVTAEGLPLGSWISEIRSSAGGETDDAHRLTDEQIRQLNELGFVWEKESVALWNTKFALAKIYYEQHGNLDIPVAYCVDGVKLGRWISNIRGKRKHPDTSGIQLDESRIRQLDSIGMDWK